MYQRNKPLVNSILAGLFYLLLCWSIDFGDATNGLVVGLMLFLPGLTFPLSTCYYKTDKSNLTNLQIGIHLILSIGIYHSMVWLFSGESRIKLITLLAAFLGSLLLQLATKFVLKKDIKLIQILITAILSGFTFLPFELLSKTGLLTGLIMGLAVLFWTIINGALINQEYRRR